jgi:hypothetical protein
VQGNPGDGPTALTRLKRASDVQEYGRGKVDAFDRFDHQLPLREAVIVPRSFDIGEKWTGLVNLSPIPPRGHYSCWILDFCGYTLCLAIQVELV